MGVLETVGMQRMLMALIAGEGVGSGSSAACRPAPCSRC